MRKILRLPQFAMLRWLLIPMVALHNWEEWLTFPSFLRTNVLMAERVGMPFDVPTWPVLQMAIVLVTLTSVFTIAVASTGKPSRVKHILLCWIASIYLANVLIPHIPAAIFVGGYAPGLFTALFINLPICLLLLRRSVQENHLTNRQVNLTVVAGVVSLPILLVTFFLLATVVIDFLKVT